MSKGTSRGEYTIRNIIKLTKRHMPFYILPLSLILSVISLPALKIINSDVNILLTLKTYFKSICAV